MEGATNLSWVHLLLAIVNALESALQLHQPHQPQLVCCWPWAWPWQPHPWAEGGKDTSAAHAETYPGAWQAPRSQAAGAEQRSSADLLDAVREYQGGAEEQFKEAEAANVGYPLMTHRRFGNGELLALRRHTPDRRRRSPSRRPCGCRQGRASSCGD